MKVLVVDDFSTMRRIVKNLLRDLGFTNIQEADDGSTALPMLKEGELNLDLKDEIIAGAMFTHKGEITHQPTKELISNT